MAYTSLGGATGSERTLSSTWPIAAPIHVGRSAVSSLMDELTCVEVAGTPLRTALSIRDDSGGTSVTTEISDGSSSSKRRLALKVSFFNESTDCSISDSGDSP